MYSIRWYVWLVIVINIALSESHPCPNAEDKGKHGNAFHKILKQNSKYEKYADERLFEGDMKRPPTLQSNEGASEENAARRNRYYLWKDGIVPYVFGSTLKRYKHYMRSIENAMREFEERTCIKFKKRESEANYVEFIYGDGCNSDVGKIGGKQQTSLGSGCYRHGIIVHELGHLVGFQHEQNRPDRDQYVKVLYDNIQQRFRYAFNKFDDRSIDSRGVPYDYHSVMHYAARDFTKNGKPTLKSLDPKIRHFGNNHLSPRDVKQLRMMYECEGKVPDFPGDFKWRTDGRSDDETCTLITEPREPSSTGWDNNFLCQREDKKDLKIRWSQDGPVSGMQCTKFDMPSKSTQRYWNNNYLCAPKDCFYNFTWSNSGPLPGLQCLAITEPQDSYMNGKKFYLCAKSTKTDGQWSNWEPWPKCSRKCGGGIHTRMRTCDNPRPKNGGKYCRGLSSETRRCNQQACSIWPSFPEDFEYRHFSDIPEDKFCIRTYERFQYGIWDGYFLCVKGGKRNLNFRWSDRGPVSGKCVKINEPRETSRRTWDDNFLCLPRESPWEFKWSHQGKIAGLPCLRWFARNGRYGWDNNYLCASKMPSTDPDNGWSNWTPWTQCSTTCGTGRQERRRTCSKAKCDGPNVEARNCKLKDCVGLWSNWTPWSRCSKTCDTGHQRRQRACSTTSCTGPTTDARLCKIRDCPGRWSAWTQWSWCSKTCGTGRQERRRTCSRASCNGPRTEARMCKLRECAGQWSRWSPWSKCSRECGTGRQDRRRTCSKAFCLGPSTEAKSCKIRECAGRWSAWTPWSRCSKTCDTGRQERRRTCYGTQCVGSSTDARACKIKQCAGLWSPWTPWSECSKTCGTGRQDRRRTCSKAFCPGASAEAKSCKIRECAGRWSSWTPWSECSKSCGTGHQQRRRTCSKAFCPGASTAARVCKIKDCIQACGSTLTADSGTIDRMGNPRNFKCFWYVRVAEGKYIDLTVDDLDLSTSRRCRSNYLELRKFTVYSSAMGISMGRRCGKRSRQILHSRTNRVLIKLKTTNNRGKGFRISWTTKVADMSARAPKG